VAADIYRPAAIQQLVTLGSKIDVPVFALGDQTDPVNIAQAAIAQASRQGQDTIIIDTAGRLHIDETLMDELQRMKKAVKPQEILLVVDAMTGQDAVNAAQNFHDQIGIDGVILTKLDGDTRGGAALSVRAVTQKPIKFAGLGEKIDEFEPFHPERMSSRILGMGDMLSLIEKAQDNIDIKKAQEFEKKMRTQQFTFDDFLDQLQQMKKMGPMSEILQMIPGMGGNKLKNLEVDDHEIVHIEAIIQSMTREERNNPSLINGSRRKRIAAGSGTSIQQVNKLLKQFEQTRKMMKQFMDMEKGMKKGGRFKMPFSGM
jgi:signal recognition particle subunit SRP54